MPNITLRAFVGREIIYCVSSLISDLAQLTAGASRDTLNSVSTDDEELRDLCERANWETPVDWHINPEMDRDALIAALDEAGVEDDREYAAIRAASLAMVLDEGGTVQDGDEYIGSWPGVSESDMRAKLIAALEAEDDGYADFGQAHDLDPEYDGVYEHWIVTDWLAKRLEEKGEITGQVCGLTIWGRCTTGQSISMDWVIQQIYRDFMGIEGTEFIND